MPDPTLDDPTYVYALNQALGLGNAPTPPWRYADEQDPYQPYAPRSLGADVQSAWQSLPGFLSGLRQQLLPTPGESARQILASLQAPPPQRPAMSGEVTPVTGLTDPVELLAGAMAPHLLPYARGVGEMFAGQELRPGMSRLSALRGVTGEAGNLGPVPRHAETGEPLPESVLRNSQGVLTKYHHGTFRTFPDFAEGFGNPDDWAKGFYFSNDPAYVEDYAISGWPWEGQKAMMGYRQSQADILALREGRSRAAERWDAQQRFTGGAPSQEVGLFDEQIREHEALSQHFLERFAAHVQEYPTLYEGVAPQTRSVYLDSRKPFYLHDSVDSDMAQDVADSMRTAGKPVMRRDPEYDKPYTNRDLLRDFTEVNGIDEAQNWLKSYGYDSIIHRHFSHSLGRIHDETIVFSPDQIYPAANVEGGG